MRETETQHYAIKKKIGHRKHFFACLLIIVLFLASGCSLSGADGEDGFFSLVANPEAEETTSSPEVMESPTKSEESSIAAINVGKGIFHYEWDEFSIQEKAQLSKIAEARLTMELFFPRSLSLDIADSLQVARIQLQNAWPQNSNALPLLEAKDEKLLNSVYYDMNENNYHFPDRELSSEELTQIALFEEKISTAVDYLLDQRLKQAASVLNRNQARALAQRWITAGFNVDLRSFFHSAHLIVRKNQILWQICFYPSQLDLAEKKSNSALEYFSVLLDSETGAFFEAKRKEIMTEQQAPSVEEVENSPQIYTTLDEIREDAFWVSDTREFIEDVLQPQAGIKEIVLQRFDGDNELIVKADMNDRSSYRVYYRVLERMATRVLYAVPVELPLPVESPLGISLPNGKEPSDDNSVDENMPPAEQDGEDTSGAPREEETDALDANQSN